ncbi:hypothetical protein [Flavimaricola marinus]|uniref:Cytochrome c domain-containing protein n=1 Tax=Flavimaricola marinus TaxID=1819565 RepID=A0A238LGA3_9RHOB|nr:hypothetical protein [Flavimaricola marinus]SMY08747.1 hypothetical protein LOM8899_02903 [Flavimaricola marinus]
MKRTLLIGLAALIVGAGTALRPGAFDFAAPSTAFARALPTARDASDEGIITFAFGDWGALSSDTLRTSASPWKLANAALALQAHDGDAEAAGVADIAGIYRSFGFHSPTSIGNWPAGLEEPPLLSPLGQNVGTALNTWPPVGATVANIGCASCHSSVMYLPDGSPDTTRTWLGMPNGSINLEAYTQTLFTAVRDYAGDAGKLMSVMDSLYPQTDWRERLTLRYAILPEFQQAIAERDAEFGRLLPFRASLAGATNGLDSLQNRLGLIPEGVVLTESIFNSVPDLGGRLWRTKLLNSGTYAIAGIDHSVAIEAADITDAHRRGLAGIIAYFTVPSMGVTEAVAEAHIDDATAITAWMQDYAPQPFPGEIDMALAATGQQIYAAGCAECHGSYDDSLTNPELTSFPNWEGDIGTDPQRARLLTQTIADAVNGGTFGPYINARTVTGYTAPPLTGIWASAPYFHNGAVPTLWHMMRPETRPAVFEVGGHRLDLARVGIDLSPPADYVPWSIPAEVDTAAFGLSAGGHEVGFDVLGEAEKDALLEYLKLL